MFSKIGCDSTTITDMLGGHAGVTETTVLQYLGIVEQRTNELLQLQAFLQAKVCCECVCVCVHVHVLVHEFTHCSMHVQSNPINAYTYLWTQRSDQ